MRRALCLVLLLLLPVAAGATVPTTAVSIIYTGDGATKSFAVPFSFSVPTDIHLTVNSVPKNYSSDYVVAPNVGGVGGTLTTVQAPANGVSVVVARVTPKLQPVHYTPNAPFAYAATEGGLDRITMMVQEGVPGSTGPQGPPGALADPALLGGGVYSLITDFDASIAPVSGLYVTLGSVGTPLTTPHAGAMFEKFSNTADTTNANAVVAIQGKKLMTGPDTRLLGLAAEVLDTAGGTDSFVQAIEAKGILTGTIDGKVWGQVSDAIVRAPATGFQSAIAHEFGVHNKVQDYGLQSYTTLATNPLAHFSAGVMSFPACQGDPTCTGYFPMDVGVYVGNPYGGLAGGIYHGVFVKNANIATTGNVFTSEKFQVTNAGQVLLYGSGTVSAPALAFVGDANNGWYRPGADTQVFVTAGVERVRIGATGEILANLTTSTTGAIQYVCIDSLNRIVRKATACN